jgi:hypothetical protein
VKGWLLEIVQPPFVVADRSTVDDPFPSFNVLGSGHSS